MRAAPEVDFDQAIRDALAVYYFPGMWEWDRAIVRPLAHDAFSRSLGAQGAGDDEELVARGRRVLDHYFDWAPGVDDFAPIRVDTDFDVHIPDPGDPDRDLVTPAGEPVHYQGRIDLLAVDEDDNYWVVDHRLVGDEWTELDLLLLDERATSFCWAWELFFLGMRIAGVIYNEVKRDVPAATGATASSAEIAPTGGRHRRMYVQSGRAPVGVVVQADSRYVRRTRVPRTAVELDTLRAQVAYEALDMVEPAVRLYPNPTPDNCGPCEFRRPCAAANASPGAADAVLGALYRKKPPEELQEGRLGGVTWAMGRGAAPPKFRRDKRS